MIVIELVTSRLGLWRRSRLLAATPDDPHANLDQRRAKLEGMRFARVRGGVRLHAEPGKLLLTDGCRSAR
jgi:hypothetical protein